MKIDELLKYVKEGSYEAMVKIGDIYYDRFVSDEDAEESIREAIFWYKRAARALYYPKAQLMLGKIYYYGRGVEQNFEEAVAWYESAAGQGNLEAMYRLGDCYYHGKGVEQNREKAMYWYNKHNKW